MRPIWVGFIDKANDGKLGVQTKQKPLQKEIDIDWHGAKCWTHLRRLEGKEDRTVGVDAIRDHLEASPVQFQFQRR